MTLVSLIHENDANRPRFPRPALISLCICALMTLAGPLGAQEDDPPGGEPPAETPAETPETPATHPELDFEDEAAADLYQIGLGHFDKGDFKEAQKCFKSCKNKVEREQRDTIEAYIKACKGGAKLAKLDKMIEKASWKDAHRELGMIEAAYHDTPLREQLTTLRTRIDGELFTFLATYEEPAPEAQDPAGLSAQGASLNTDETYVKSGERSLRWAAQMGGMGRGGWFAFLPVCKFDGTLMAENRYLNLSIYSPTEDFGKFTLYFAGPDSLAEAGMDPTAILKARCFFYHMTINKKGWIDLRIDVWKEVQTLSNTSWDEIETLGILMIPPSKPKTIFLDDVKLERK